MYFYRTTWFSQTKHPFSVLCISHLFLHPLWLLYSTLHVRISYYICSTYHWLGFLPKILLLNFFLCTENMLLLYKFLHHIYLSWHFILWYFLFTSPFYLYHSIPLWFLFFNWSIIDLQRCVCFRCKAKWFSYIYILFQILFPYWLLKKYWL